MKQLSWYDYFFKASNISKPELNMLSLRMNVYSKDGFNHTPYDIMEMNDYDFILYYRQTRIRGFVSKLSRRRFDKFYNKLKVVNELPYDLSISYDDYTIIHPLLADRKMSAKEFVAANIGNNFFDMEMAFVSNAMHN